MTDNALPSTLWRSIDVVSSETGSGLQFTGRADQKTGYSLTEDNVSAATDQVEWMYDSTTGKLHDYAQQARNDLANAIAVRGLSGNDEAIGSDVDDVLKLGGGNDRIYARAGNDLIDGGAGDDILHGQQGHDVIVGGTGVDQMFGGEGNDVFYVDDAHDQITEGAGAGYDTLHTSVSYVLRSDVWVEVLATTSDAGTDGIDLAGNEYGQTIQGNAGSNNLSGEAGDDRLFGGAGDDFLDGGTGSNTLSGGSGADRFALHALSNAMDRLEDFRTGQDKLIIDHAELGISATGSLQEAGVDFAYQAERPGASPSGHTTLWFDPNSYTLTALSPSGQLEGGMHEDIVAIVDPGSTVAYAASPDYGVRSGPWQVAAVADFNGDGVDDVLWRNPDTGQVDEWQMKGGYWSRSIDLGANKVGDWQLAGVGDLNGDGVDDVLWHRSSTQQVDQWQMKDGHWSQSIDLSGTKDATWSMAGVGDFNGDGTDDLLWRKATTQQVDQWQMQNGHWSQSIDLSGTKGTNWEVVGVGDLNANGTDDILWRDRSTGETDGWVMRDGNWGGSAQIGARDLRANAAGMGDFDGDGAADVLWRNDASGQTDQWQLTAATPHASDFLIV